MSELIDNAGDVIGDTLGTAVGDIVGEVLDGAIDVAADATSMAGEALAKGALVAFLTSPRWRSKGAMAVALLVLALIAGAVIRKRQDDNAGPRSS